MVDHTALAAVLDQFSATVTGEFAAADILACLAEGATQVLATDGAGVMVPHDGDLLRFAFATTVPVADLERLQQTLATGPCRKAHTSGRIVNVGDLACPGEWPQYRARARALGLHSVAALPLRGRGQGWGVLDLYRASPHRFDETQLAAAQTLANLATSYLVVTEDRDTARRAQDALAHHAMHDLLTGLPLRWVFLDQLTRALARLRRHPGHLGVLFLDLDGLKSVNDSHGHLAGDHFIRACAERIRAALRPTDLIARIGGDEFVILLEDVSGTEDAARVAGRILDHLGAPYQPDRATITPSASIGVVVTTDPRATADTLIAHADAAMYRAKHTGRARFEVFDPAIYAAGRSADGAYRELTAALRAVLPQRQLELHYQPIIDLRQAAPEGRTGAGTGAAPGPVWAVEALVRWRHPQRGLLPAEEFIGALERDGLIVELGAWVLTTACRQLLAWDGALDRRAPQRLFVNVSVAELVHPALPRLVADTLADTGLDPARLTLEITETGLVREPRAVAAAVASLRQLGCGLAIDDFGTGYSSLSRLVDIPASTLKIDRSFTRALSVNQETAAVVSAILHLGHVLHRVVVVEGVEDGATLTALRQLGATHAQGFHLALPQHADAITTRLGDQLPAPSPSTVDSGLRGTAVAVPAPTGHPSAGTGGDSPSQ